MKNKLVKRFAMILGITILCMASLLGCQKGKNPQTNGGGNSKDNAKEIQLLGFDNYKEITDAKIYMGEQFGRMAVNKDKNYITQGSGSLFIRPQGDYGNSALIPSIRFKCFDTAIATSNFADLKKISFDVYNNTDKELHIKFSLTALDSQDAYITTPVETFTLEPGEWNTCDYNLDTEGYLVGLYNLSSVQYIHFEFPEAKTSKEDVPNEFYLDNLKGYYFEEKPEGIELQADYWEKGVTFEEDIEKYLVRKTSDNPRQKMELTRVSYADEGMTVDETFGEYGMKGVVDQALWGNFIVDYLETVPKGTILSFMVYVDQEPIEAGVYRIAGSAISVSVVEYLYNEWFEVKIQLGEEASATKAYFNFDASLLGGAAENMFGGKQTVIYMDNFKLTEGRDPYVVAENGDITVNNDVGAKDLQYDIKRSMKKGEEFAFELDFKGTGGFTIWFKANGQWNSTEDRNNEFIATVYKTWEGKQKIEFQALKDVDYIQLRLQYHVVGAPSTLTISNWRPTVIDRSVVTLGDSSGGGITYDFNQPAKKGDEFVFDIDFTQDEKPTIWVLADKKWNSATDKTNELYAMKHTSWEGKTTLTVRIAKDVESLRIRVVFGGDGDRTKQKCILSNMRIVPGTFTISNQDGDANIKHTIQKPVKAGDEVTLDIDFNTSEKLAIWVLADGKWNSTTDRKNEFYAEIFESWNGKQTLKIPVLKDADTLQVYVTYKGASNKAKNVCTITDVQVHSGTYKLKGADKARSQRYNIQKSAVAGDEFVFDIDFNTTEKVTIWVLANGKWNSTTDRTNELYANPFASWTGKQTIHVPITKDVEYLQVVVNYGGTYDTSKNVCTINNTYIVKGTNVIKNLKGDSKLFFDLRKSAQKGDVLNFMIDFNTTGRVTVKVLANGTEELYNQTQNSWKKAKKITLPISKDVEYFVIAITYGGNADKSNNVCTISDVVLNKAVTLANASGSNVIKYTIPFSTVKAGDEISFDVDINTTGMTVVYVLANGKYNTATDKTNEMVPWVAEWPGGKQSFKVKIQKDIEFLQFVIAYRGEEDYSQNICKISNIVIK